MSHNPVTDLRCVDSRRIYPFFPASTPVLEQQNSTSFSASAAAAPPLSHWLTVGCFDAAAGSPTPIYHGIDSSAWRVINPTSIGTTVDTSAARFPSTPTYVAHVVGAQIPSTLLGARSVLNVTANSFLVAISQPGVSAAELLISATHGAWQVHWTGAVGHSAARQAWAWKNATDGIVAISRPVSAWDENALVLYSLSYRGEAMPCLVTAVHSDASIQAFVKSAPSAGCDLTQIYNSLASWSLNVIVVDPSLPEFQQIQYAGKSQWLETQWDHQGAIVSLKLPRVEIGSPGCWVMASPFYSEASTVQSEVSVGPGVSEGNRDSFEVFAEVAIFSATSKIAVKPDVHFMIHCRTANKLTESSSVEEGSLTYSKVTPGMWSAHEESGVVGFIDASEAAFSKTPTYAFTLYAPEAEKLKGMTSVFNPSASGFSVWIRSDVISTAALLSAAQSTWSVRWIGSTDPAMLRQTVENAWAIPAQGTRQLQLLPDTPGNALVFAQIVENHNDHVVRDQGEALYSQFYCTDGSRPYGKYCITQIAADASFDWFTARDRCASIGGVLPSIHSNADLLELADACSERCWIGLLINSDMWTALRWEDGSSIADFSSSWWSSGSDPLTSTSHKVAWVSHIEKNLAFDESSNGPKRYTALCAIPRVAMPMNNPGRCPSGFTYFASSCWALTPSLGMDETYARTALECGKLGASPASILSREELDFAFGLGSLTYQSFFGGNDRKSEGFYINMDGALPTADHVFSYFILDNHLGNEDCLHVPLGGGPYVNDAPCSFPNPRMVCRRGTLEQPRCGHKFFEANGFCWRFFENIVWPYEAESFCQGYGANLPSVHDSEDWDLIKWNGHQVWGGLQKQLDTFYHTDGTPHDYSVWGEGQPDNNGGAETYSEFREEFGLALNDVPPVVSRRVACKATLCTQTDCCPLGFRYVDGSCWRVSEIKYSANSIDYECGLMGGIPAPIFTMGDLKVATHICSEGDCWVGLRETSENGTFRWTYGDVALSAGSMLWAQDVGDSNSSEQECGYIAATVAVAAGVRLSPCSTPRRVVCRADYGRCPQGYHRKAGRCYRLLREASLTDALALCSQFSFGRLATLARPEDREAAIYTCATSNTACRIGLQKTSGTTWGWIDGSPLSADLPSWWSPSTSMASAAYDCAALNIPTSGEISDVDCTSRLNSVCTTELLPTPQSTMSSRRCPPGFTEKFNSCWRLSSALSYTQGGIDCGETSSSPASVLSESEFQWISSTLCSGLTCFIGLRYRAESNAWKWEDDSLMFIPASWWSSQDSSRECTVISGAGLVSEECVSPIAFPTVCRRPLLHNPNCGAGYHEAFGKCWKLRQNFVTSYGADAICWRDSASLATIRSDAELKWAQRICYHGLLYRECWIGLRDDVVELDYRFLDGYPASVVKPSWWDSVYNNPSDTYDCVILIQSGLAQYGCNAEISTALCGAPLCSQAGCCPVGFDYVNGACWMLNDDAASFSTADLQCALRGGSLASIESPDDLLALNRFCEGGGCWVGLSETNSGTWSWSDGTGEITRRSEWWSSTAAFSEGNRCAMLENAGFAALRPANCQSVAKSVCKAAFDHCPNGMRRLGGKCYDFDISATAEAAGTTRCNNYYTTFNYGGLAPVQSIVDMYAALAACDDGGQCLVGVSDANLEGTYVLDLPWNFPVALDSAWLLNSNTDELDYMAVVNDGGAPKLQFVGPTAEYPSVCARPLTAGSDLPPATDCPEGFTRGAGSCWQSISSAFSYYDGLVACASIQASVASIRFRDELSMALHVNHRYDQAYLAVRTSNDPDTWVWTDGTTMTPYTPWADGSPSTATGLCAYLLYVGVTSVDCFTTKWPVCKRSLVSQPRCGEGYVELSGSCWKKLDTAQDHSAARANCGATNAQLATLHNHDEIHLVKHVLCTGAACWIGLSRDIATNSYKWANGSPIIESLFASSNLDPATEDCVAATSTDGQFSLTQQSCTGQFYGLCRAPLCSQVKCCPQGFELKAGVCWLVPGRQPATAEEAQTMCEYLGGTLATIGGPEELAAASDACRGRECWLALSDVGSDGVFMWADGSGELESDSFLWDWPRVNSEGVDCGYVVGRGRSSRIRLGECRNTRLAVCKAPYARCPVGFERKGNACFRVVEPKSHTSAAAACEVHGGKLAPVHTAAQLQAVHDTCAQYSMGPSCWVGYDGSAWADGSTDDLTSAWWTSSPGTDCGSVNFVATPAVPTLSPASCSTAMAAVCAAPLHGSSAAHEADFIVTRSKDVTVSLSYPWLKLHDPSKYVEPVVVQAIALSPQAPLIDKRSSSVHAHSTPISKGYDWKFSAPRPAFRLNLTAPMHCDPSSQPLLSVACPVDECRGSAPALWSNDQGGMAFVPLGADLQISVPVPAELYFGCTPQLLYIPLHQPQVFSIVNSSLLSITPTAVVTWPSLHWESHSRQLTPGTSPTFNITFTRLAPDFEQRETVLSFGNLANISFFVLPEPSDYQVNAPPPTMPLPDTFFYQYTDMFGNILSGVSPQFSDVSCADYGAATSWSSNECLAGSVAWTVGSSMVTNGSASYFVLAMQGFSDVSNEVWFGTELIASYSTRTMVLALCSWHLASGAPYAAAIVAASDGSSAHSAAVHSVAIADSFNDNSLESVWSGPGFSVVAKDAEVLRLQLNSSASISTSSLRTDLVAHNSSVVWQQAHPADEIVESIYFSRIRNEHLYIIVMRGGITTREDSMRFDFRVIDRDTGSSTTLLSLLSTCKKQCSAALVDETNEGISLSVVTSGLLIHAETECTDGTCKKALWASEALHDFPVLLEFQWKDHALQLRRAVPLQQSSDRESYSTYRYAAAAVVARGNSSTAARTVAFPTGDFIAELSQVELPIPQRIFKEPKAPASTIPRDTFPNNLVHAECADPSCLDGARLEFELLPLSNGALKTFDLARTIPTIDTITPSTECRLRMNLFCGSLGYGNAVSKEHDWICEKELSNTSSALNLELQQIWVACELESIRVVDERCAFAVEEWCSSVAEHIAVTVNASCAPESHGGICHALCQDSDGLKQLAFPGYSAAATRRCMAAQAATRTWNVETHLNDILNDGHSLTHAPVDSCTKYLDTSCRASCGDADALWYPTPDYTGGSCRVDGFECETQALESLNNEWVKCYSDFAGPRTLSEFGTPVSPLDIPSHILLTGVSPLGPLVVPMNTSGVSIVYGEWVRISLPLKEGVSSFWIRGAPTNNSIAQARLMWPLRHETPSTVKQNAPWYLPGHEEETMIKVDVSSFDVLSGFSLRMSDLPTWGIRGISLQQLVDSKTLRNSNVCGMVQLLVGPEELEAMPHAQELHAPPTTLAPVAHGFGESESIGFGYFRTFDSFALHLLDLGCRCLNGTIVSFDMKRFSPSAAIHSISLTSSPGFASASVTVSFDVAKQLATAIDEWIHVEGVITDATYNLNPRQLVGMRLLYDDSVGNGTTSRFTLRDLRLTRPCFSRWFTYKEQPRQIQTMENGEYVTAMVEAHTASREADQPFLENGGFYRILTVGSNVWGDETPPVCTRTFTVDDTPPDISDWTPFDIPVGPAILSVDVDFIGVPFVKVAWKGEVKEPESSPDGTVDYYIVAVTSESPEGTNVLVANENEVPTIRQSLTSPGYLETLPGQLPNMVDGEHYFVHVGVMNRGRVESVAHTDGFTYDGSPPGPRIPGTRGVAERVEHLGNTLEDIDAANLTSTLVIAWEIFDPHSTVSSIHVGIGENASFPDINTWVQVSDPQGELEFMVEPGLAIDGRYPAGTYYGLVRACNGANICAVLSGDGVIIDGTPPAVVVLNHEMFTLHATPVTSENTNGYSPLELYWECTDDEAIYYDVIQATADEDLRWTLHYRICVGEDCSGPSTSWLVGGKSSVITTEPLHSLLTDASTATSVRVEGCCSNAATLQCGPVLARLLSVHQTRPGDSRGEVEDKDTSRPELAGDVDYLASDLTPVLSASWTGFEGASDDPIAFYEVAMATTMNYTMTPAPKYQVARDKIALEDGGIITRGTPEAEQYIWMWNTTGLATTWTSNPQSVALIEGETYYIFVRAWSKAGVISQIVVSDGVQIDNTPPSIEAADVRDSIAPVPSWCDVQPCAVEFHTETGVTLNVPTLEYVLSEGIRFTSSVTSIAAFWSGFEDSESGIARYRWGVGSCNVGSPPASFNTKQMQFIVTPESFATDVQMFQGLHFCIGVAAENYAGMLSDFVYSRGVTLDITPPSIQYIRDGPPPSAGTVYKEVDSQLSQTEMMVHWVVNDPTSGILEQELRLFQAPQRPGEEALAITNWTAVGKETTSAMIQAPHPLVQGHQYYAEIRVTNGALLQAQASTDGVVIDTTGPRTSNATVFHNFERINVEFSIESKHVRASWGGFDDPETLITEFWWAIGTTRHATDVLNVTYVGSATYVEAPVDLEDGTHLFVTVWASNDAGLTASIQSASLVIDSSGPATGIIYVTGREVERVQYVNTRTALSIQLEGFEDFDTDVQFEVAIQNYDGLEENLPGMHVPWTPLGTNRSIELRHLSLTPGIRYSAQVRAINAAGLSTHVVSQAFMVDDHAPIAGILQQPRHIYSTSPSVTCTWHSFMDDDSGIFQWHVGVGSSPGQADLYPFLTLNVSIPAKQLSSPMSQTFSISGIPSGTPLYCAVSASDYVGHWSEISVGMPVYYDTSPPVVPQPILGSLVSYDNKYVELENPLFRVKWQPVRDPESGVSSLSYCVGTAPSLCDLVQSTHIPVVTTSLVIPLENAADHTVIFFTLFASNFVGLNAASPPASIAVLSNSNLAEDVQVKALYLHAHPSLQRDACVCVDPHAIFDIDDQECMCSPGYYLGASSMVDLGTGQCQPCPAGTCKNIYGNSLALCEPCPDSSTGFEPARFAQLPLCNQTHVERGISNDASMAAGIEFYSEEDERCRCGPGYFRLISTDPGAAPGPCVPCPLGTAKQVVGDSESLCNMCHKQHAVKGVVAVEWSHPLSVQTDTMDIPGGYLVSIDNFAAGSRWTQVVPSLPGRSSRHTAVFSAEHIQASAPRISPLAHSSWYSARVILLPELLRSSSATAVSSGLVATAEALSAVDTTPPGFGTVVDGPTAIDIDAQTYTDHLSITWRRWHDEDISESPTAPRNLTFVVGFGFSPGDLTVSDGWIEVAPSKSTSFTLAGLSLCNGCTYFGALRITSPTNAVAVAYTDGVTVRYEPPKPAVRILGDWAVSRFTELNGFTDSKWDYFQPMVNGNLSLQHAPYQSEDRGLVINWNYEAERPLQIDEVGNRACTSYFWGLLQSKVPNEDSESSSTNVTIWHEVENDNDVANLLSEGYSWLTAMRPAGCGQLVGFGMMLDPLERRLVSGTSYVAVVLSTSPLGLWSSGAMTCRNSGKQTVITC